MNFDAGGIQSIHFSKEKNECYPLGIINEFMEIQVESARLEIKPNASLSAYGVPLLANEAKLMYGLDISKANLNFTVGEAKIKASSDRILAGANYVAGSILVGGYPHT